MDTGAGPVLVLHDLLVGQPAADLGGGYVSAPRGSLQRQDGLAARVARIWRHRDFRLIHFPNRPGIVAGSPPSSR